MGSIGFAGLLLALRLVQARAGYLPNSQSARPSQTALANDFCSIGGDDLLPSQNFCTTAGLNKDEPPTDKTCKLLDIAERLAASVVVPTGPAACTAMLQTSVVGKQLLSHPTATVHVKLCARPACTADSTAAASCTQIASRNWQQKQHASAVVLSFSLFPVLQLPDR